MEGMAHVFVGFRPLALGVEHWAVFVGLRRIQADDMNGFSSPVDCDGLWYEIDGSDKTSNGTPNKIWSSKESSKKLTRTEFRGSFGFAGTTADLHRWMAQFNETWIRAHPVYAWNGHNCQMYVKHVLAMLVGVELVTQNARDGMTMQLGGVVGMAVALSGVGLAVFAVSALLFLGGRFVKGPH